MGADDLLLHVHAEKLIKIISTKSWDLAFKQNTFSPGIII